MKVGNFETIDISTDMIINHLDKRGLITDLKHLQLYTINHKQAFMATQLELLGSITDSAILHDVDKLVSYGMITKPEARDLHRKYSVHHNPNQRNEDDMVDTIIDYECARFTKPDKPLNAYQTLKTLFPTYYDKFEPTLARLKLNSPKNVELNFAKWNQNKKHLAEYMAQKSIEAIDIVLDLATSTSIDEATKVFYTKYCDKVNF